MAYQFILTKIGGNCCRSQAKGNAVIQKWRAANPLGVVLTADPLAVQANATTMNGTAMNDGVTETELTSPGGLYLYWNRNDIKAYFPPTV